MLSYVFWTIAVFVDPESIHLMHPNDIINDPWLLDSTSQND